VEDWRPAQDAPSFDACIIESRDRIQLEIEKERKDRKLFSWSDTDRGRICASPSDRKRLLDDEKEGNEDEEGGGGEARMASVI
jgi:hypothetical protein